MSASAWVAIVLLAWVVVSALLAPSIGRSMATRPAPPSDPDCWPCQQQLRAGPLHTCGRRAGEWVAESRTRGGRP